MVYLALALAAVALAAWDIARRALQQKAALDNGSFKQLTELVERAEHAAERNDNAIKNLISQVLEITRYQEQQKQVAAASKLQRSPRG